MTVQTVLDRFDLSAENRGTYATEWLTSSGDWISSYNPSTGELLGRVQSADPHTYNQAVIAAQETFQRWRMVPAPKRGDVVRDLGAVLREYKEPLGDLVALEMGKIRVEGAGEVQEMIDICDFAVGLSRQLYGVTMGSERPQHRMYEQWHPLGPIGIISAFNFPVAVWSWNAAIAAICGDTMLWKPSELTPLVSVATQKLANRVMADHGMQGLFNLVVGGGDIGRLLTEDKRLPLVSFTGSIPTGRKVAATVAQRLGRSILELGGNNAIVVTESADLDLAIRGIVFGAVGTAGQRCTSTRRIIAQRTIVEQLTQQLVAAYKTVHLGDPLEANTLVGPLVTEQAVHQMQRALELAQEQGGELLVGGNLRPDLGANFIEPAIVRMPAQTAIVQEETFAPILYILEYDDLDQAIALQNGVTQGLSSAIFTDGLRSAEKFLSHAGSDCGIANVNIGTSGAEIGGAFGGEKDTGGGRESGSDAWKGYMRRQTNTINWSTQLPLAQGITFG